MTLTLRGKMDRALTYQEVDNNFLELQERIELLESSDGLAEKFTDISCENNQLHIRGSRGSDFGPFDLGLDLQARGPWKENTHYKKNDLVQKGSSLFLVKEEHTSGDSFAEEKFTCCFKVKTAKSTTLEIFEKERLGNPEIGKLSLLLTDGTNPEVVFADGNQWLSVKKGEPI